ncbi:helix-turn-helix transcriptional regulator [Mesorhizobium sp. LHD-90]|uniref:helix-turn-helix transcriptional regulator n=1 Tax=Mesorhizobium sp. LHD-90 TaxID=3071414 RepID=UPI0027E06EEF|nr:helix-turn-helix transcriptional regulator [Mesorhizobium sp. LHD-90]MDQ6433752.1 helix-turn-helix transcriptional regulator [Mesorhizobium sp. LHD-90]
MSRPGKDGGRLAARNRKSPFGAASPDGEPGHTLSVADAVRRCRWIAIDINAAEFALFFASPSLERARLVPCFDALHPAIAPGTRLAAGRGGEAIVRHARTSSLPCWWGNDGATASERAFAALDMAERTEELVPGCPGIAFPVFGERGQCGLIAFWGNEMVLAGDQALDIHARCFSLFAAVSAIRSNELRKLPTISKRELECLKLTANGLTSEQIAASLKLSVHTANQYLTSSAQKLDATNRTHAVAKALRLGLFE